MLDEEFCEFLEYEICKAFSNSDLQELKYFGCDGVLLNEPEKYYSKKYVNDNRVVKMKAYIFDPDESEYEMFLKFGNKSLSRYARGLDIKECVPDPGKQDWIKIDTKEKKIEIQLY
jgi:hypothetical protein